MGFNRFALGSKHGDPCFFGTKLFGAKHSLTLLNHFCTRTLISSNVRFSLLFNPTCGKVPVTAAATITLTRRRSLSLPCYFGHGRTGSRNRNNGLINDTLRKHMVLMSSIVATKATVHRSVRVVRTGNTALTNILVSLSHRRQKHDRVSTVRRIRHSCGYGIVSVVALGSLVTCLRRGPRVTRRLTTIGTCHRRFNIWEGSPSRGSSNIVLLRLHNG